MSFSYLVSQRDQLLPGVQVERAVATMDQQEVALEMAYPVAISAQGNLIYMSIVQLLT